ncbi:MAG TPA: hypothetical protein VGS22_12590 [Thermoanaerobaculia bacterium]|nr:hypothetical protein [Thermoanaerobaculia bacterium]
MIVDDASCELVALFADLDAQKLFERLVERGQESARQCVRTFRWRSVRDPRRDPVWSDPVAALRPFLALDIRYLIVWDHRGSGAEKLSTAESEARVFERLEQAGVQRDRVLPIALAPELESAFVPVWDRVKQSLASRRKRPVPNDREILQAARRRNPLPDDFDSALAAAPKEVVAGLFDVLQLRRSAVLYEGLGDEISLPRMKTHLALTRIAETLATWFPYSPRTNP